MIDRKLHLIPSGIIGGFNKRIQELLRIPTYTPKISDVMRPTLTSGILKGDASSPNPGVPVLINAIKSEESNLISLLTSNIQRTRLRIISQTTSFEGTGTKSVEIKIPSGKRWIIHGTSLKWTGTATVSKNFMAVVIKAVTYRLKENATATNSVFYNMDNSELNYTLEGGDILKGYHVVSADTSGTAVLNILYEEYDA